MRIPALNAPNDARFGARFIDQIAADPIKQLRHFPVSTRHHLVRYTRRTWERILRPGGNCLPKTGVEIRSHAIRDNILF